MDKKIIIVLLALIVAVGGFIFYISSINKDSPQGMPQEQEGVLKVVATTTMITDLINILGGDVLEITGLMGPGIDPHSFIATESDVRRLQEADMIFFNGLHLEGKMADLFKEMNSRGIATFAITDAIPEAKLMEGEDEFEGSYDPHIWFDAELWVKVTYYVRDILTEEDPRNSAAFKHNAEKYIEELIAAHDYVKAKSNELREEQRILVTAHDAFQYFGRAYGFEVEGIEGISTESEAGIADIRELADFIAERQIKAIFMETSVTTRNVEALRDAVTARGFKVSIGGEIYSDAMGSPGTPTGTYTGMMKYNIDTIVNALK